MPGRLTQIRLPTVCREKLNMRKPLDDRSNKSASNGFWPASRKRARPSTAARRSRRALAHAGRSDEHTSELQSLMRTPYAVFCLHKNNKQTEELFCQFLRQ